MTNTLKNIFILFMMFSISSCSDSEYIDMEGVYTEEGKAYLIEDNTLVNGKVRMLGGYKRNGVLALFSGRITTYEGYYTDGLKDMKWFNYAPDKSLQEGRSSYIKKIKEIWDSGELLKVEYYGSSNKILEATYFNSTGCASAPIFKTNYWVQNNSSIDIILNVNNGVQRSVLQNAKYQVGNTDHCEHDVIPSENDAFKSIQINKGDAHNNLVLIYNHGPIQDTMWIKEIKDSYNFDFTLLITDELLGE